MTNLDQLSREELVKYIRFLSGLTMAIDGLWFLAAEKSTDFEQALSMDVDMWSWYAPLVVKRIRKNFSIEGEGLEGLKAIISHDPIWWSMDMKITEETPQHLIFEIRDCPSLLAMEKMERKKLTCEPVEYAYLEALARAVDPKIKVKALKLPPRQSQEEICCRWEFSIEST